MTKHHRIGGSTLKRVINCPYSIPAAEIAIENGDIPAEQEANYSADKGTAVHTIGEKCHETGCDPIDYHGTKIIVESGREFVVDHHMVKAAEVYVNYCRQQEEEFKAEWTGIEFNSELSHLYDGEDVGGPCDYAIYGSNTLIINDYKNGVYPVEVKDNPQFLLYALGVYETLKDNYPIKKIRLAVIQPNFSHPDGPCRHHDYSVRQLQRWKRKVLDAAIARVKEVTLILRSGGEPEGELTPHADEDWCVWCPINGMCSEYNKLQTQLMKADFNKEGKIILPEVNTLTVEEAERIIDASDAITKFIAAVKQQRKSSLLSGEQSDKYKLVESRGNRKYNRSERRMLRKLKKLVPDEHVLFKNELLSPAQMEGILKKYAGMKGKEAKEFIDKLCDRPLKDPIMVSIDDTREALSLNPEDDFK